MCRNQPQAALWRARSSTDWRSAHVPSRAPARRTRARTRSGPGSAADGGPADGSVRRRMLRQRCRELVSERLEQAHWQDRHGAFTTGWLTPRLWPEPVPVCCCCSVTCLATVALRRRSVKDRRRLAEHRRALLVELGKTGSREVPATRLIDGWHRP
jgi:hypothetical protein